MNGTANGYEWVNAQLLHYDSIGNAFMSTFVISSGGWGPLLRDTLAATEIDKQPSPGANLGAFAYFCLLYTSPSPRDGLLSRMPSSA